MALISENSKSFSTGITVAGPADLVAGAVGITAAGVAACAREAA